MGIAQMDQYQVTVKFGNKYEIVGHDTVSYGYATELFNRYINLGYNVRIHKIYGAGSYVLREHITAIRDFAASTYDK